MYILTDTWTGSPQSARLSSSSTQTSVEADDVTEDVTKGDDLETIGSESEILSEPDVYIDEPEGKEEMEIDGKDESSEEVEEEVEEVRTVTLLKKDEALDLSMRREEKHERKYDVIDGYHGEDERNGMTAEVDPESAPLDLRIVIDKSLR